jgi:hypothetical protein
MPASPSPIAKWPKGPRNRAIADRHRLRRPRRGRRALRRQASVFRWLLADPLLRPFSRFARCLASLRTRPPNLPSATVWGFLRTDFFIAPLHFHSFSPGHEKHSTFMVNSEAKVTSSMKTRKSAPYACGIRQKQRTGLRVFGALDVARSAGPGGAGGPARAEHGRAPRPAPLRFMFVSGLS